MRVIIAGPRDCYDYSTLEQFADAVLVNQSDIEIVSGRCSVGVLTFITKEGVEVYGVDGLGERYAKEKGYSVKPFPADWAKYGKKAGPIRNIDMAEYADGLIALWDGKSKGTKNMILLAREYGLKVRVKMI